MSTKFKKIKDYTLAELDTAVNTGVEKVPDFYPLLNAIDAYFERRRRKEEAAAIATAEKSREGR